MLTVFNDAGVGRDSAGVTGLAMLAREGLAACTVAHTSARIGDAASSLADGIISHANALARARGIACGQLCQAAIEQFTQNLLETP